MVSKTKIKIVGIFACSNYQKCKLYADYLYDNRPDAFEAPTYRPMFDVQWTEFLHKTRIKYGLRAWMLQGPVAVFMNDEIFGNEDEFVKFCHLNYSFQIFENFIHAGEDAVKDYISNSERTHVYMTVSMKNKVIGTILLQLFNDLVPVTCANFIRLVKQPKRGFTRTPIYRIAKTGWIQIGGPKLKQETMACENYYVPHDRRGILSMCNNGKHTRNNTQFFISLQPSSWMDYYYVAFGIVLHGQSILETIENLPTTYEHPDYKPLLINSCGIYNFVHPSNHAFIKDHEKYWSSRQEEIVKATETSINPCDEILSTQFIKYPDDVIDRRDTESLTGKKNNKQKNKKKFRGH